MIHIGGRTYELVYDHKNGWNPEAFRNRYSDVLDRYDYVIGDWGYNQLRLKGFFRDTHPKANSGSSFSSMSDYINEYCNFGCAYFVLLKQTGDKREDDASEDIYLDEIDISERLTGAGDTAESAYRQVIPAAAEQTAASAEGAAAETPTKRERPQHQRREGGRSHGAGRRDSGRDHDRSDHQDRGDRPERGERQERSSEGRKPYYKDRGQDKEGGRQHRSHGGGGGERSQQGGGGQERPRSKRPPFSHAKAPVAAASETQQQRPPRGNSGSKGNG
ncbi:uncharacterized protein YutD [Paenibacillus phyllosphaerae]|uniref:Uncharacterized protein YutD n=1 Tax=Paenibacillus phyllosphaerae TaxID=274593 RepID=A0A7W5B1W3_9BACL|nr:YutD family protein [Paenibacillus phyllosphaerae]MBB3112905.1 uncharacterized protein YutD [Paenibacillus phyllosphaerae]